MNRTDSPQNRSATRSLRYWGSSEGISSESTMCKSSWANFADRTDVSPLILLGIGSMKKCVAGLRGPWTTPPPTHCGDRILPCLARPIPFCGHGLRPPPRTSALVLAEANDWKKVKSISIAMFTLLIHTTYRYSLCQTTFCCIMSNRGKTPNTLGWSSINPRFSSLTVSKFSIHTSRGFWYWGGNSKDLSKIGEISFGRLPGKNW